MRFRVASLLLISILLLLVLPSVALAGDAIYTWGYGDLMVEILTATKLLMGANEYQTIVRVVIMMGMAVLSMSVIFSMKTERAMDFAKLFVIVGIVDGTFLIAKTDIVVDDLVAPGCQSALKIDPPSASKTDPPPAVIF